MGGGIGGNTMGANTTTTNTINGGSTMGDGNGITGGNRGPWTPSRALRRLFVGARGGNNSKGGVGKVRGAGVGWGVK